MVNADPLKTVRFRRKNTVRYGTVRTTNSDALLYTKNLRFVEGIEYKAFMVLFLFSLAREMNLKSKIEGHQLCY